MDSMYGWSPHGGVLNFATVFKSLTLFRTHEFVSNVWEIKLFSAKFSLSKRAYVYGKFIKFKPRVVVRVDFDLSIEISYKELGHVQWYI